MAYKRIECPICLLSYGQEAKLLDHLSNVHNVCDHLKLYLDVHFEGIHPTCQCSANCTDKLRWLGWKKGFQGKYSRGHNARVDSVYHDAQRQKEMAKKRAESYASGQLVVWNKGLSKETSDRVQLASEAISATLREGYASGRLVDWRAENPEKAQKAAEKISSTKKSLFASGEIKPWNLGLSKETSESIAAASSKISDGYKNAEAGRRLKTSDLETRIHVHCDKFQLVSSLEDYKRRRIDRLKFVCLACGSEQLKSLAMLEETPICFSCSPKESKGQLELYDFIRSFSSDAILSDRKLIAPREVDILVPSARLAVEYNGLYWHSAVNIADKNYHESKRKSVEVVDHKFLMIFEDEWRDKREIVESMIRHRLKAPLERLDARKLKIEEIDGSSAASFFEAAHLEGHARSMTCLGLVDGSGRIIAAMSLRRPFHASRASSFVEVARSACLPGVSVRGWIGRLTSASLKKVRSEGTASLVSYVDSRVGNGRSYLSAGWRLESLPRSPRFWWTDFRNRYNRFKYRADKSSGLSQSEVADREGVVQLWGCGNYVVVIG